MIGDVDAMLLVAIVVAAFGTGILHGATGMAGGVVMAAILAHPLGVKTAVPVMTVALIFSHLSRAVMYARETDWQIAGRVLLFGCPTIVLGAVIFGLISAGVALLRLSRERRRLRRELKLAEAEVKSLRSLPLHDAD